MAVDAELISCEGFNLKFKNYLRDFFIYQFKERGSDFKSKGTNDKSNVNKDIVNGTFYSDAKRLQVALETAAGVTWSKGDIAVLSKGYINKRRENKRVECVTVDSRRIGDNPFFSLYQLCGESALEAGTHFSLIYAVLLYFQLGKQFVLTNYRSLNCEEEKRLEEHLISLAEISESNTRRHDIKKWIYFSEEDKQKFALEAIARFQTDHNEVRDIYEYMVLNRQQIIFEDGKFKLIYDRSDYVEKNVLYKFLKIIGVLRESDDSSRIPQEKQFVNKMQELTRLGIVFTEKRGQRLYYALSNVFLNELFSNDEDIYDHFMDCVSFFSQVSSLGEIGSYILGRMSKKNNEHMRYKHNYIKKALNDYNNIDLLYAIKNELWIVIEYRNAAPDDLEYQRIVCYPIEIRESVSDGRQYLIYYHPVLRSVSAVRIEFIDSITIGTMSVTEYFDDDLIRARKLIDYTWGTAFDDFWNKNVASPVETNRVRVIIMYGDSEKFIKARLQRELRACASVKEIDTDKFGKCLEVVAEVVNTREIIQWLRSYTTRIVTVEINGKEFTGFTDEVVRTYKSYLEPIQERIENIPSKKDRKLLCDDVPKDFVCKESMHSLLFNELFSIPFVKLGEMLLGIMNKSVVTKTELQQYIMDYSSNFFSNQFTQTIQMDTEDKRIGQAENFIDKLVRKQGSVVHSLFRLTAPEKICSPKDLLPLTSIEIQWLKNILSHPIAKGFLSELEIENILEKLGDIELFDINSVVLYDQHIGLNGYYKSTKFGVSLPTIMKAIRDGRIVSIKYKSQYGRETNYICSPVYIEYSKRDNCMRVRGVSQSNIAQTFNLERILEVIPIGESFRMEEAETVIEKHIEENKRELVVFFNETKNVPDRILTEFSCFKKKCVKWGDKRYCMTLYYDKEDTREILVRLLSYGSSINVFDDSGSVCHELKERLRRQLELTNSMDLVFAVDAREKE